MDCYIDSKLVMDINLDKYIGSGGNKKVSFCNRKYLVDLCWKGEGRMSLWDDLKHLAIDGGFKLFCNGDVAQKKLNPKCIY